MINWFNWKTKHLDERQQEIIDYFKKINPVFEKALKTQYRTKESGWKDQDPKNAYKIVTSSLEMVEKITPPLLCSKYHNLSLQILRSITDYQKRRIDLGDAKISAKIKEDQLFEEKLRGDQLDQSKLEEEKNKEYFAILRKIGFFNNAIKEMSDLKLITPKEKAELERLKKENKE